MPITSNNYIWIDCPPCIYSCLLFQTLCLSSIPANPFFLAKPANTFSEQMLQYHPGTTRVSVFYQNFNRTQISHPSVFSSIRKVGFHLGLFVKVHQKPIKFYITSLPDAGVHFRSISVFFKCWSTNEAPERMFFISFQALHPVCDGSHFQNIAPLFWWHTNALIAYFDNENGPTRRSPSFNSTDSTKIRFCHSLRHPSTPDRSLVPAAPLEHRWTKIQVSSKLHLFKSSHSSFVPKPCEPEGITNSSIS